MITVKDVWHDYEGKGRFAVSSISFQIEAGEIFGFLGPSGAGKSTVQNIMTGLLPLQRGEVLYGGTSVKKLRAAFFNQVGVSFEQPNLYGTLTGLENLKYFAAQFSVPTIQPMALLERVGLRESANKKVSEYSKGMKQRLTLARALLNKPQYLFLDEPTSGLDPTTSARIRELIREQSRRGAHVFLTTHNMELADALCDRVSFLSGGKISAMDAPEQLKRKYGKAAVSITYECGQGENEVQYGTEEKEAIAAFIKDHNVIKMHTQEASLDDIFRLVTGEELSE